jgi:hypothetical protein
MVLAISEIKRENRNFVLAGLEWNAEKRYERQLAHWLRSGGRLAAAGSSYVFGVPDRNGRTKEMSVADLETRSFPALSALPAFPS